MTSGPEEAGVDHINDHGKEHFGGILQCSWTEMKGRIVHATRDWQQGEVILAESPCHIVQEDADSAAFRKLQQMCKKHKFDYEPLWYWCALKSLTQDQLVDAYDGGWDPATELQQKNLLLLHHEVDQAGRESEMMATELVPNCDPMILERLTQIWVLNCFEYSDSPTGYSVYFFSSFMSHSCYPNAVWHYTGSDHVLRARRDIKVGDEVCIAYLPEDGLLQPVMLRRHELHQTKHFWCDCERCDADSDTTRGLYCPACGEGIVFSMATDPANKKKNYQASAWQGRQCNSCGHALTNKQGEDFAKLENKLMKVIDDGIDKARCDTGLTTQGSLSLKDVQENERWMEANFAQHFLVDSAWEQLAEYYVKHHLFSDQRRVLEKRCDFQKSAYPGLSGSHAWSLEALADALKSTQRPAASAKKKGGSAVPVASTEQAVAKYQESLQILRLMFGDEHEYVTSVVEKLQQLQATKEE